MMGSCVPADASLTWTGGTGDLTFATVIPEPGTVSLLTLVGLGFVIRRRRGSRESLL